jgi:transcriptional regulator with XRE-family HTH domain
MEVGQNIKAIRELKNLTQVYMAKKLKMSVPNYSNIEANKIELTLSRLEEIAAALGVDYRQILSLNPAQVFNNSPYSGNITTQLNYVHEELIKQLQTKDEQILQLTTLLKEAMLKIFE